jgi:anti-sigma factor RsiW
MQLDGELPEQDFDRVETHLRFCPECSAWAEQVQNTTLRLRDSLVEVPAAALAPARHGRRWRVGSAVALASAAAVVAAMFVAPGQRLSVNSRNRGLTASSLEIVQAQTLAVSRLSRLADNRPLPTILAPYARQF